LRALSIKEKELKKELPEDNQQNNPEPNPNKNSDDNDPSLNPSSQRENKPNYVLWISLSIGSILIVGFVI